MSSTENLIQEQDVKGSTPPPSFPTEWNKNITDTILEKKWD